MKTKITFKAVIFFLFAFGLCLKMGAQNNAVQEQVLNYKKLATKKGSNYFDIVNSTRAAFNLRKSEKKGKLTLKEIKEYKHFERWAYFWRDRVDANGAFPSQLEGWKNAGLLDANYSKNNNAAKQFSGESWTNIGPQTNPVPNDYPNPPQLGRLNTFWRYVDAGNANNNILIVGAPTGGIWKSTDNGATWAPKFDTFAGIGITDIKGSSSDIGTPGVLYASTGDYDATDVLNSIGVYKSTDMGDTWVATNLSFDLSGAQLLGHMVVYDDNTVVVATANGISKTTNGGTTWIEKFPGQTGRNFGRMASFGTNIVVSDGFEGLSFSTDSGETWADIFAPSSGGKYAIAADESGNFFIQKGDGQIMQLDLTGAGSASNLGVIPSPYDPQGGYNQVLLKRGGIIIGGSVNGNHSSDNGASWYTSLNGYKSTPSDPGIYMHSDHHQAGYLDTGLSFWFCHDGGLSFINYTNPTDQFPTEVYKSEGVINTQVYTISINPSSGTNDDFIMANQDNDAYSKESGQWVSMAAGDGVASAIDYTTPNIRYVGGTEGSLTRSTEALGFTGNHIGENIPKPGTAQFVWPLSLDTSNSTIAYGGFDDLYKSTNISTTTSTDPNAIWTSLNAGAGSPIKFDNQGMNIAVVGTAGLRRTSDGGATWSDISQPAGVEINSFSIDAASASGNTIYATAKGYVSGSKVFKSTDGGANWTNISGTLPNILMKKVLLKQNQTDEYLFVATELGVYYKSPTVTNWTKLGNNLPNVIVNDMKINYMNNKMYIGTYGRGMWEINIDNSTLGTKETKFTVEPKIFPNPVVNDFVNVKLSSQTSKVDYVIYNIVGGAIAKGSLTKQGNRINLNNPAKGVYIIKLNEGNKVSTQKFIVR